MSFVNPTNYPLIDSPQEVAQPFNIDQFGEVGFTTDLGTSVQWHVLSLLLTSPGERVMRPNYGVGLFGFVFENDDPVVVAQYQGIVSEQVALYEPGVQVTNASVTQEPSNPGQVNIALSYSIQGIQQSFQSVITSTGQVVETQ